MVSHGSQPGVTREPGRPQGTRPARVSAMIPRTRQDKRHVWLGGSVAGVLGGFVTAIFATAVSLIQGEDIWVGAKMAGAPFLGDRALQPGFDAGPLIVGVLSHFAVSMVWGVFFAYLFYGLAKGLTVVAGACWGILVWLGMFYLVLPVLGLVGLVRAVPVPRAILEHVLFGIGVGFGFVPFQRPRKVTHRAPTPTA